MRLRYNKTVIVRKTQARNLSASGCPYASHDFSNRKKILLGLIKYLTKCFTPRHSSLCLLDQLFPACLGFFLCSNIHRYIWMLLYAFVQQSCLSSEYCVNTTLEHPAPSKLSDILSDSSNGTMSSRTPWCILSSSI